MFCPECLEEFPWYERSCPRCSVELVERLPGPAPDPDVELVPVFTCGDAGTMLVAKSVLDSAGIEYLVKGEGTQDLFGWGRLGAGYNVIVGPAEFMVRAEDAARARELLEELRAESEPPVEPPDEDE